MIIWKHLRQFKMIRAFLIAWIEWRRLCIQVFSLCMYSVKWWNYFLDHLNHPSGPQNGDSEDNLWHIFNISGQLIFFVLVLIVLLRYASSTFFCLVISSDVPLDKVFWLQGSYQCWSISGCHKVAFITFWWMGRLDGEPSLINEIFFVLVKRSTWGSFF